MSRFQSQGYSWINDTPRIMSDKNVLSRIQSKKNELPKEIDNHLKNVIVLKDDEYRPNSFMSNNLGMTFQGFMCMQVEITKVFSY